MTFTVAAVDDHPALLLGLTAAFTEIDGIDFIGTAATVGELLESGAHPDVVLLDLRLDDGSTPAHNVRDLRDAGSSVVVYTQGQSAHDARAALGAGALTIVNKTAPLHELLDVLTEAAQGETRPTTELAQALETDRLLTPALSSREREVLRLYAADLPAKSVARRIGLSEGTVKVYLRRVRAKYEALDRRATTKLELYQRAVEDGLIEG